MVSSEYWFGARGFYNDVATQSLRFDDGSVHKLTRTFSSAVDNDKKMTISVWVKRGTISNATQVILSNYTSVRFVGELSWKTDDKLSFDPGGNGDGNQNSYTVQTTSVFRDVSSWYHIVLAYDTTQSTDTNRVKIYVNGTQQTLEAFSSNHTFPPQNYAHGYSYNGANNEIGNYSSVASAPLDGYLSEFNFIDGLALDPTYFGETKNGVWIPKEYSGSYGSNGYRLEFKNTSVGTGSSSTIGADTSGNDNHWTSSGIVASDCNMPDSPENNFCTMNSADLQYNAELHEGNLHIKASTYSGGNYGHAICTFKIPSSGKWYIEILSRNLLGTGNATSFGVMDRNVIQPSSNKASPNYVVTTDEGFDGLQHQHYIGGEYVAVKVDGSTSGSNISMSTSGNTGSVSALAIDVDNGYLYVGATDGVGGTGSQIRWLDYADGSTGTSNVNPESGSSGTGGIARTFTNNDVISVEVVVSGNNANKSQIYLNAGQDSSFAGTLTAQGNKDGNGVGDFYYVVPSGYLALCTSNLPETTISPNKATQADNYFNTVLYTGNGSTQSITGVGFQPDWVWGKDRGAVVHHTLTDSSRGVHYDLFSSSNSLQSNDTSGLTAFDSDGFSLGSSTNHNVSSNTYVAWNWLAGGATPSKTYKVVVVSDSGNKYRFRNSADDATFAQSAVTLNLQEGGTYTFDLSDSSMSGHPFVFSTTSNGTHGGGSEYTTGVTKTGTAGSAGASIVITVASSAPTLYYYCSNHSGMGGQVNTNVTHGSTNFDGSTLSVSNTNTTAGFSIVTYTGSGSGATIGHGVGKELDFIIAKRSSDSATWAVYSRELGSGKKLELNGTSATITNAQFFTANPTSSVFSLGTEYDVNGSGGTFVAYCFAEIEGFSKFGNYTGNGSINGTFVYTGFRPAWVMCKITSGNTGSWNIFDNARDPFNEVNLSLLANSANADDTLTSQNDLDFVSNGFKIREDNNNLNGNGYSFIYMAFAEQPFKYANAR
tara:strand:- start:1186 stop:4158 length:2973 start_codon:yes stop_codon:yes gene_type:complete